MPANVTAMKRPPAKTPKAPPAPTLPARDYFTVAEVAAALTTRLGLTTAAVERRLYRGIQAMPPQVRAVRVLGSVRIPRAEAERLLSGERI